MATRKRHPMTTIKHTKTVAPTPVPDLPVDLDAALRRLKLAAVRRVTPEVLLTAKTQRWAPEELLRTLVKAEIAARDASNTANRLKAAGFPITKTLESFNVAASSIPRPPSTTWPAWNGVAHNTIWPSLGLGQASHTP